MGVHKKVESAISESDYANRTEEAMAELSWNGEVRKSNASAGQENTQVFTGFVLISRDEYCCRIQMDPKF